ncbi:hypothetical protein GGI23_004504, partial [Coemansia sp. RSA 2559]
MDNRNALWLTGVVPPLVARALVPLLCVAPSKQGIGASVPARAAAAAALALALAPALALGVRWDGGRCALCYGVLAAVDFWLFRQQLLGGAAGGARRTEGGGGGEEESLLSRVTYFWVLRYVGGRWWSGGLAGREGGGGDDDDDARRLPTAVGQAEALDALTRNWRSGKDSERRLARAIARTFMGDLWICSGLQLAVYAGQVGLPVLVARILHHVSRQGEAGGDCGGDCGAAAAAAARALAAYAAAAVCAVVVEQNQIDMRDRLALKIGAALTALVHRALLDAPTAATGEEAYAAAVHDARALAAHIVRLGGSVWLPVRVAGGLYVFYRQVGWWAVAAGVS